jgi:hypothetical protein
MKYEAILNDNRNEMDGHLGVFGSGECLKVLIHFCGSQLR